ncbi:MAG: histidinol dehydrogenase [Oscillospiraceae bacterium]|jgi:histidinol dehydrogenase|nr:histidinol dehydrogenase [Oscillospiraceae bacterium]
MIIRKYKIKSGEESAFAAGLAAKRASGAAGVDERVAEILADVKSRGYEAVREYSLKPAPFDGVEPYELTRVQIDEIASSCDPRLYSVMERSAANVRDYQSRLLPQSRVWSTELGELGQLVRPLNRVGIYVPGGTAAYPSSVLMTAVPAKVAGVSEIVMCTPPTSNLNAACVAAAKIAGVDRIFALGGVQAIAAMAYGAGPVPRADKIVGPGNAFVAAAKRLVFGEVDIDMIAGPSEIFIVADDNANPIFAAADMLSQAEHDKLAAAILATDSAAFADAVIAELERRLPELPRSEIAASSLSDYGAVAVCDNLDSAVALANCVAPEHLELITADPHSLLNSIQNAGAIFVGGFSPEPLGDYSAGPSHVLPTNGTARFFSALSVDSFIKRTSLVCATERGIQNEAERIAKFARAEGLEAHAKSAELRLCK